MNNGRKNAKKKLSLKERWKDKRERAKIELMLYGIFFLVIIIFARISSSMSTNIPKDNDINNTFIDEITDNYQYDIDITIDNNKYKYSGKKLGNNMSVTRIVGTKEEYFYQMNDKYYILDTRGNYILTTAEDIYPYIEYRYLNINNIKQFIKLGTKNDTVYSVKVSDIVLNNNSADTITLTVNEEDKNILIDYTNLFKIDNSNINKAEVNIKYSNINSINSLEE